MSKLIKQRKGKVSRWNNHPRIYLQDSQLKETQFQPGAKFAYLVDNKNKKITITLADESKNSISSRNSKSPIIDIRSGKELEMLQNYDEVMISIYEDQVIISVLEPALDGEEASSNVINLASKGKFKIKQRLSVKKDVLRMAAGSSLGQISIDEYLDTVGESEFSGPSRPVIDFRKAVKDLEIPLMITSIYSGAGGLDHGFIEAGYTVDFALELDEGAVETYRHNIGDHIVQANIMECNLNNLPKNPVFVGGPFCKRYSNANRTSNISSRLDQSTSILDHPDNCLIRRYVDAVKANHNCKVFVLENVPQILSVGIGQRTVFDDISDELSDFDLYSFVLNSADFGSGQKRKRAFIIGSKIGKIEAPEITCTPDQYKTVRESFAGITATSPNQGDYSQPKSKTLERIACVRPGHNWKDIPMHLRTKKESDPNSSKHDASYRRLDLDSIAHTITNVRKVLTLHPSEDRTLSVRESAALFDLPHDFEFKGSLSSKQQQVANMVPSKLAFAIATTVKNALEKYNQKYQLGAI